MHSELAIRTINQAIFLQRGPFPAVCHRCGFPVATIRNLAPVPTENSIREHIRPGKPHRVTLSAAGPKPKIEP